jgi:hypothetical protein
VDDRARDAGGRRRTHKHWLTKGVPVERKTELVEIAVDVWRIAGADQHFVQEVWDAGGAARYLAGLVGHHLKASQAPPKGWRGRRVGQSRGYYSEAASALRVRAEQAVRDDRLVARLEREVEGQLGVETVEVDEERGRLHRVVHIADEFLFDELLAEQFEQAKQRPKPRVVPVSYDFWERAASGLPSS